jgi:hypothetical protein
MPAARHRSASPFIACAVKAITGRCTSAPRSFVRIAAVVFPSAPFDHYGLVRALGAQNASQILRQVTRLTRLPPGAEIESAIDPQAPDDHGVRRPIRFNRGDPIVVRFFQALLRPAPRQQAFRSFGNPVTGHVGTGSFGFLILLTAHPIPSGGTGAHNFRDASENEWCRRWDSNPRPRDYETLALPLSYTGIGRTL